MTELEAIAARHSVRAYQKKPIDSSHRDQLVRRMEELNALYDLHMQYIEPAGEVFSGVISGFTGWRGIPAYIALVGKKRDELDELCGYAGEQLVLYAQTLGLNTCWAGLFKRKRCTAVVGEDERLVIAIAVGYGRDNGKPRRSKSVSDVTDAEAMPDWFKAGVEAALLAPTAINQQKFIFSLDGDTPSVRVSANGPFVRLDLGIVKYHFELASGRIIKR